MHRCPQLTIPALAWLLVRERILSLLQPAGLSEAQRVELDALRLEQALPRRARCPRFSCWGRRCVRLSQHEGRCQS